MKYFRHFSNASSSLKVQRILDEMGLKGYAQYFLLLELLNEKFDGESTKVSVHLNEIAAKVRLKFDKSLTNFIQKLSDFELISFQLSGKVYEIDCPILLELMDRDSKFNRTKRVANAKTTTLEEEVELDKEVEKELDKEKEKICTERPGPSLPLKKSHESFQDDLLNPYLDQVPLASQEAWIKTYQDIAFIKIELMKAVTWIANNPTRAPKKNYGNFFSNWLSRGWESHRKNIKRNPSNENHFEELRDKNPWRNSSSGEVVNG